MDVGQQILRVMASPLPAAPSNTAAPATRRLQPPQKRWGVELPRTRRRLGTTGRDRLLGIVQRRLLGDHEVVVHPRWP